MTEIEHFSTRQLISKIEAKDVRFRISLAVFMGISIIIMIGVILFQLKTLDGVRQQLDQQKVLLEEQKRSTDEIKATVAELSNQLDCIAKFFAQRSREDAQIADLDQCTIIRQDGSVVQSPLIQAPNQAPETPPTISPDMPGLTPLNPQQPADPPTDPESPPVEILGIPICIPFTGVCLR